MVSEIAGRQHGLVTAAQLLEAGISRAGITRRVQVGRLHRRHRGVYSVGPLSREGQLMAAVLAGGPGAVLSHWAAAELLGVVSRRASIIDVVVPRKRRSPPGVRFREGTIHWQDVTDRAGIRVTSVPRLLVDLTDVVRVPHEIAAVIREGAHRGWYSLLAARDARDRANGRRKVRLLDEAIALYEAGSAGTRSGGEVEAITLLAAQGLPRPIVNTKLLGEEPDFCWPAERLVIELDRAQHGRAPARREDAAKDAKLRVAGYQVIRVHTPDDVVRAYRAAIGSSMREGASR